MPTPAPSTGSGTSEGRPLDRVVARYDRITELRGGEVAAWLMFHLPSWGARALDAGCGTGVHTEMLAGRYNEVLAVDPSEPIMDYARRHRPRGNVRYETRDLQEVGVSSDGQFDLVFSAHALHRLPDPVAALRHLRSLTRPEGTVLLVQQVDNRGNVPVSRLRADAFRAFRHDVLRGRRPIREAVELLQLSADRDWLDHQTADRPWTIGAWENLTNEMFPGARTTEMDRARALAWRAPTALPRI